MRQTVVALVRGSSGVEWTTEVPVNMGENQSLSLFFGSILVQGYRLGPGHLVTLVNGLMLGGAVSGDLLVSTTWLPKFPTFFQGEATSVPRGTLCFLHLGVGLIALLNVN